MRRIRFSALVLATAAALLGAIAPSARASATDELTAAKGAGQASFMVVTDASARGTPALQAVAADAAARVGARVIVLDRGAAENAELVKRYRLASAPVPLVLVIARNGLPVAGLPAEKATSAALVAAVPSPRKLETFMALNDRRAVFVVVSGAKMAGRAEAVEQANAAMRSLEPTATKARVVLVDVADPEEAGYVAELTLGALDVPTVVVFNAAGKRITTLRAPWTAQALAEAAVKTGATCCEGGVCGHERK